MNLHEYQAKQLLSQYSISVPIGYCCTTPQESEKIALKISNKGPWVVKCQVHAGGRGKAGGVKIVYSKEEVLAFSEYWLGRRLVTCQTDSEGLPVNQILIEEVTCIEKEFYLGVIVDYIHNSVAFMASTQGGIEIEKIAEETPDLIHKITLDPLTGAQPYQGRELAFKLGLTGKHIIQFAKIFLRLVTMFMEYDLTLLEINPLVITNHGELVCLDGKLTVDSNALFRQPKLRQMRDLNQEDLREAHAIQWDLNYVALDGNIGFMVNGAGLAMATMDIVKYYGGRPANFLDVGGSATKERVAEAFKIILSDISVKVVFINIFGGIVRCDLIADGIINAISEVNVKVPVVVRLEGNSSDIGIKKLESSGLNIIVITNLTDAAKRVVMIAAPENK